MFELLFTGITLVFLPLGVIGWLILTFLLIQHVWNRFQLLITLHWTDQLVYWIGWLTVGVCWGVAVTAITLNCWGVWLNILNENIG
jgi:hypothetical protein